MLHYRKGLKHFKLQKDIDVLDMIVHLIALLSKEKRRVMSVTVIIFLFSTAPSEAKGMDCNCGAKHWLQSNACLFKELVHCNIFYVPSVISLECLAFMI